MRKRQVKKFALQASRTKNITAYRAAWRGGSKRMNRRARAFARFTSSDFRPQLDRLRRMERDVKFAIAQFAQRVIQDSEVTHGS